MNEFYENSKRIISFIKDRPWLFTKNPYIDIAKYIKYFEYGEEDEFYIFPSMLPYKMEILDEYKSKVYNTLFLPTGPSSLGLHTIVQINPKLHIVFIWGNSNDNKEAIVYATLHTAHPNAFVDFLKEREDFVYDETPTAGFFNPLKP